jgi:hypothetical protein
MGLSVIEPIEPAMARMRRVLFVEADLAKWLTLGFCAFLADLPSGGGGGAGPQAGIPGPGDDLGEAGRFLLQHLPIVILIGGSILVVIVAIVVLFTWLSSRGRFMFLDGVARNAAAVAEPWRRFRTHGNSLFLLRLILGLIEFGVISGLLVLCALVAWPDLQAERFGPGALFAVLILCACFVPFTLALALINALLGNFVVPVMYLRDLRVLDAWGVFMREIVPGNAGSIILFILMRMVFAVAAGVIVVLGVCLTCCLAALPYVSSVVFLPISVFMRSYSLCFLEQLGPDWRFFTEAGAQPTSPAL